MKTNTTRLLAVLMSLLLLAAPALANAEATQTYFTISDPVLSVSGGSLDFTGLSVDLTAEQAEAITHLALDILASGDKAASAHLALGEAGIQAYVEGMSSAFIVTTEAMQSLAESAMGSSPFAKGFAMGANADQLYSDEALAKFVETVQGIATEVVSGELAEDTFVTLGGETVQASRIDFEISNEQLLAIVSAEFDLIASNPEFYGQLESALQQAGVEGSLKDTALSAVEETGVAVNGSIYVAAESMDFHVEGEITSNEGAVPYKADVSMNEDGLLVTGSLREPNDGSEEIAFQLSVTPNTAVEGKVNVLAEFGLYDTDSESGDVEAEFYFTLVAHAEPAANGGATETIDVTAGKDGSSVALSLTLNTDPENEQASASLSVDTDGEVTLLSFAYAGKATETGHAGAIEGSAVSGGQTLLTATANVEFGTRTGADSIAFDFSALNSIDVTTLNEDAMQSIMGEAMGVVQRAMGVLQNVPGVAALLTLSAAE